MFHDRFVKIVQTIEFLRSICDFRIEFIFVTFIAIFVTFGAPYITWTFFIALKNDLYHFKAQRIIFYLVYIRA